MVRLFFSCSVLLAALLSVTVTGCGSDKDASRTTTCSVGGVIYQSGEELPQWLRITSRTREYPGIDFVDYGSLGEQPPRTWTEGSPGEVGRIARICGDQAMAVRLQQMETRAFDLVEVRLQGSDLPAGATWEITQLGYPGSVEAPKKVWPHEHGAYHVAFWLDQVEGPVSVVLRFL